jgi:hypothetical protein
VTRAFAWLRTNSARLIAGAAFAGVVGGLALAAGGHHQAADWLASAWTPSLSCRWREHSRFANTWPARSWR